MRHSSQPKAHKATGAQKGKKSVNPSASRTQRTSQHGGIGNGRRGPGGEGGVGNGQPIHGGGGPGNG